MGYSDSNWGGDLNDRKSTTEFIFYMDDMAFTWLSKKQAIVTLSTCKAKYIIASLCACHDIWIKRLLQDIYFFLNWCYKDICG